MKPILVVSMMLATASTVHAGWFGLTEDYPYKSPSLDRTLFVASAIYKCTQDAEGKTLNLSSQHITFVCTCKAEKIADTVTKKELEDIHKNGKPSDKSALKVAAIFNECLQHRLDNLRLGSSFGENSANNSGPSRK